MKIAISLPEELFNAAEDHASRRKISRSALIATALAEYLESHSSDNVTARLNEIYANESNCVSPEIRRSQVSVISKEDW